jgi:hypothetical protein
LCFGDGLRAFPAHARDLDDIARATLFFRKLKHRLEQSVIANGELGCMDCDRNSACSGREIVAGEGTLAALVQAALAV